MGKEPKYQDHIYYDCKDLSRNEKGDLISRLTRLQEEEWSSIFSLSSGGDSAGMVILENYVYLTPKDIVIKEVFRYNPREDAIPGELLDMYIDISSYKKPIEDIKENILRVLNNK